MLKTHKIALDPNNVQATQFAQHCGYARVAYNHVLADFKDGLATDEWRSHIELNKRFNAIKRDTYEWCSQLNQRAAHNAIYFNFQDAIKRWKSGQSLFPKFKKRSKGQSFQADAGRGTTKTCSACGAKDSNLSLSDRTYRCSECGHTQNRDLNAAINLRTVAMGHTET